MVFTMSMGHFGSKFNKLEDTAWTNVITDHPPSGRCGYIICSELQFFNSIPI